jgi:hypothetical protein
MKRVTIAIGMASILVASCAKEHAVEAGFWFDRVTYDLPVGDVDRIGGPIRPDEQAQIESMARAELEAAYAGLRVRFTGQPAGFYRVSVVQDIPGRALPVAGASRRVPFGGGVGSVSFRTLGAQAVAKFQEVIATRFHSKNECYSRWLSIHRWIPFDHQDPI